MRRIGLATAAAALLGSLAVGSAPAQAEATKKVCDPVLHVVCVLVLTDPGEGCPPGYQQIAGVPIPRTNRAVVRVCALQ
ncbi:MAG TPA: hypothetical protein VNA20_12480 [Frankiaceae bacterium]|nr:hypothetical protein [Frankiaceae bacterium]